jgi:hypothetical protein
VKVVLNTITLTRIIYNLKQIHKTKTIFFFLLETNICGQYCKNKMWWLHSEGTLQI